MYIIYIFDFGYYIVYRVGGAFDITLAITSITNLGITGWHFTMLVCEKIYLEAYMNKE